MAQYRRRHPAANKKSKPEKKPFPRKKVLILLGLTVVFFSFYQIACHFFWGWVLHAYCIAAGILGLAYVLWNRGLFSIPSPGALPADWSDEKKDAFIREQGERKRQSSFLLYLLIPLLITVVFDMVYLFLELNMGMDLS